MRSSVAQCYRLFLFYLDKLTINPTNAKPNTPKNIIARAIVNANLSCFVILCSSLIIWGRSVT